MGPKGQLISEWLFDVLDFQTSNAKICKSWVCQKVLALPKWFWTNQKKDIHTLFSKFNLIFFQWPTSQQMPYPAYKSSVVTFVVTFMAFFTALSFTFIIPPIMKRIVQEKKSGGKELMKMMGLPSWMNWFFHYLDAILTIMISLIIIVILVRSVFSMKSNVSPKCFKS